MKEAISSVDGDYEQKIIDNFVDNELFAQDSRNFRTYIKNVSPDMDLEWGIYFRRNGGREDNVTTNGHYLFLKLKINHRQLIHSQLFDLIFHGQRWIYLE